jgi:molybdenum cofactor biosynthesis protein MoaC
MKDKGMFNVSSKPDTYRMARAQAILNIHPKTATLLVAGESPKGNIIEAAKFAATSGAKKTPDLIPYCHPIPLDHIIVNVSVKSRTVEVNVEVKSIWKTGVEMEALTGACIGALTIYDMLKPVDHSLSIGSVKILNKFGGLADFGSRQEIKIRAAVIVISDSVAAGKRADKSGKFIAKNLKDRGMEVVEYKVLSDDRSVIEKNLKDYSDNLHLDLILTTGGTGIGPRDITPEATRKVIEKEVNGIAEASRAYGQRRTPLSMLSRGLAGVRGRTVIINLPGSLRAVSEYLDFLFPGIEHAFQMMKGNGH